MKNYLLAIAILMGTIIGVGMFALPFVIVKSGVITFLIFMPVLAVVQYYLHLLFAEVVLSTQGDKRLPGYSERYSGKKAKIITLILSLISDYGVILVYIIFGGIFLHQLLAPVFGGSVFMYATILYLIQILIVWHGLKTIAGTEFFMTGFMVLIICLIIWRGRALIAPANFILFDWHYMLYPYGPVFFSIGGMAAIPHICKLLSDQKEKIRSAVAWGTFSSAVIMSIFALGIVGMTGANTTPDSLTGLSVVFSDGPIIKLALVFGLFAIMTSLICIAEACKEIFWWDFKMNKNLAWALACVVPYILYLAGVHNLTKAISLTGAFSGGMLGLIVIFIIIETKKQGDQKSLIKINLTKPIAYALSCLFILGLFYEIWSLFIK